MHPRLEEDFATPENEEEYTVPDSFLNLDELAEPSPNDEQSDDRGNTVEIERPRHSKRGSSIRHSYHGGPRRNNHLQDKRPTSQQQRQSRTEEDDTFSKDYGGLSELTMPFPVESRYLVPHDDLVTRLVLPQQGRSPTTNGSFHEEEEEENLAELAGSARVQQLASRSQGSNHTQSQLNSEGADNRKGPPPSLEKASKKAPKFATEIYTVSYLVLFSIFGTLARLGLQALTFYPGAPVQTGVLWCNFGGSLIIGFLSEDQKLFREDFETSEARKHAKHIDAQKIDPNESDPALQQFISAERKQAASKAQAAVKKTIPLYIGLATGFCGSFTSFSSFIRDAYLALANALPVPVLHTPAAPGHTASIAHRNGGYSFMAICAVIILTVIPCIGALVAGGHLAVALEPFAPGIPSLFARRFIESTMVFLAWVLWLGAIVMSIWPPDRPGGPIGPPSWPQESWRGDALFAVVFAPVGCLLRFYVSLHLNGKIQSFPLGTFAVNVLGTAMEGMFYDLQHMPLGGRLGCQILQGLMDGFCGCLTTVSTWMAELKGLRLRHAYMYGAASVGTGVSLMVAVMGSVQWTRGFRPPSCPH